MITLISFIIVIAGAANWLIIGLMQYDFVAGIFGTQSSLLSRLIYIIIGVAAIWILLMAFVQKGKIKINDNGFGSLNKIAPAKKGKEQKHTSLDERENSRKQDVYDNYEYSSNQSHSKQNNPNEYSHPNTADAGEELYSQNSEQRQNPFD